MAKQPARHPDQTSKQRVVSAQWQGPLPPPDALAHFSEIIPNGAERIMRMVEEEQAHRISYEKAHLIAVSSDTRRGHYIGLAISISAIGSAVATATALRLARAFGTTPGFWLSLQATYDTEEILRDHGDAIAHIQPLAA